MVGISGREQIFLLSRKLRWTSTGKTSCRLVTTSLIEHHNQGVTLRSLLHLFWKTKPQSHVLSFIVIYLLGDNSVVYLWYQMFHCNFQKHQDSINTCIKNKQKAIMFIIDDLKDTLSVYSQMKTTLPRSPWCLPGKINATRPSPPHTTFPCELYDKVTTRTRLSPLWGHGWSSLPGHGFALKWPSLPFSGVTVRGKK